MGKAIAKTRIKKTKNTLPTITQEIMTLVIYFHIVRFRDFKTYYTRYVMVYLRESFPHLVSYSHVVNLLKSVAIPLCIFIHTLKGEKTGIYFVDSMVLKVCHIKREKQHRVFNGLARKAKSTMG
jgi:hypothetical protein